MRYCVSRGFGPRSLTCLSMSFCGVLSGATWRTRSRGTPGRTSICTKSKPRRTNCKSLVRLTVEAPRLNCRSVNLYQCTPDSPSVNLYQCIPNSVNTHLSMLMAACRKAMWNQPTKTYGFWSTDRANVKYHVNLDPAVQRLSGRHHPYEDYHPSTSSSQ